MSEANVTTEQRPIYQGEPTEEWFSREIQDRAAQTAIWVVAESAKHYDPLRRNWDDWHKRYTNQPVSLRKTSRIRSNVPSGRVSEVIDTFVSDMISTIDKSRPLISALPREDSDRDAASVAEQLIQFNFDNFHPSLGYIPAIDQSTLCSLLYGGSPSKMMWVRRVINQPIFGMNDNGMPDFEPVVAYQGPVAEAIFPYDHFPHPHKQWADDHYPQAHMSWGNFADLKELERQGIVFDVDKIPDMSDFGKQWTDYSYGLSLALGDIYRRTEQRQQLGWTDDPRLAPDGVLLIECECMFRPKIDWTDARGRKHQGSEPIRTIILLANGRVIRVGPSPLLSGDSVWTMTKFNHLPGQFYGQSVVQKIKPMVHVEEVVLNMAIQSLAQALNRIKILRPDLLSGPQAIDDQPGGIINAKTGADINQVMREIITAPVINDALNMIGYASGRTEGMGGASELKQGRLPTGERTATASSLAFQQSSKRFRHALIWIGATTFNPWARKMWAYNQTYLETPFLMRVLGSAAQSYAKVEQKDLQANPDFVFMGPARDEHEQMAVAQLQSMVKILTPFMQFPWGQQAIKEHVLLLAERFNIMDIARFKKLIEYQEPASLPMAAQAQPGTSPSGSATGAAPAGAGRQDRRIGSPATNTEMVKALGGRLSSLRAS